MANNKPASTYAGRYKEGLKEAPIQTIDDLNPSAGSYSKGNYKPIKTTGIKIRGTGAATKGTMARGPMG
jgi:hypothetical protein